MIVLQAVTIERPYKYGDEPDKPLTGKVTLKGPEGTMEINLSATAIGRITACIAQEVETTAKINAKQAGRAMESASNETALLGRLTAVEGDHYGSKF